MKTVATLATNTKNKLEYLKVAAIIYIKGDRNCSSIHLKNGNIYFVTKIPREHEAVLYDESTLFVRLHKWSIVNISHIKYVKKG